jgi:PAS domain S-box-containing protein
MDNTERERAKEALGLSEEKFHKAFRSSPDMVVISTLEDGFYIDVNDAFLRNTGYERKEVIGHTSIELGIWANPDNRAEMIKILRERGAVRNYDATFRMKSGEIRFVLWSAEVIDYGDEKCLIAVTRDITDRKRAEKAVRERTADLIESEEKYRTLVENVPLVVYRMKPSGEILFVNQFVEEAFGYSTTEIFRNPKLWNEKVYDDDRVRVKELREKSFLEGEEFVAEYRVKHKNGSIVYIVDHAIPFEAAGGLIGTIDGIMMDVTGRVKLQEKLVRAEGLKTITEVSARLAHEIRNPLVSAGGFARRLLSSMGPDDPNRAKVEIIVKEVGRLETILRMILNYIQPMELDKSPTDPNELVERALSAVDMEIKERNVRIDLRLSQGLPEITVDRPQMELVVETLAKQALNQIQEGATLSVSTFRENEMLKLVIRYPVQHMSSDDVEHFFYPFTTSQMAYDTADLPMSKIVVDKHGGMIDVSLAESGELIIQISVPL